MCPCAAAIYHLHLIYLTHHQVVHLVCIKLGRMPFCVRHTRCVVLRQKHSDQSTSLSAATPAQRYFPVSSTSILRASCVGIACQLRSSAAKQP